MQPASPPVTPHRHSQLMTILALVVVAAIAGVGGYLLGASNAQSATLHISVANSLRTAETVQVLVNGQVVQTAVLNASQNLTQDVHVTYATANGAYFQVTASVIGGPHDTTMVFIDAPGTYTVSLTLGG